MCHIFITAYLYIALYLPDGWGGSSFMPRLVGLPFNDYFFHASEVGQFGYFKSVIS